MRKEYLILTGLLRWNDPRNTGMFTYLAHVRRRKNYGTPLIIRSYLIQRETLKDIKTIEI